MAKQLVNIGTSPNDGTGDPLRNAMSKLNDNLNEIYNALGDGTNLADIVNIDRELDSAGLANKISFLHDDLADLQAVNPSLYEGTVGFVTETGSLYYAHDGAWNKLLTSDPSGVITDYTDPLGKHAYANNITNAETSGYVLQSNGDDTYTWVAGGGGGGGSANTFGTIAVAGQTDVKADSTIDTLTLVAGSNITITTNPAADEITINASGSGGGSGTDLNSLTGGTVDVAADSFGFIDADDSNNSKKDTIADFVSAIAGTNLTASNGVLNATGGGGTFLSLTDTPASFGSAGQAVVVNSGGNGLEFTTISGGGGGSVTRGTASGTTASIADAASDDVDITGYKGYVLYSIQVDQAAWVRVYDSAASRSADSSRAQGVDPSPNAGVIAEAITTGSGTVRFTPGVFGMNNESTPTTTVPITVTNNSGGATAINVTLTLLQLEA